MEAQSRSGLGDNSKKRGVLGVAGGSRHDSFRILGGVLALVVAAAVFVVFLVGVIRDPRSFSNAVLLGLALAFGALGLAELLADTPGRSARLLLFLLALVVAAGPFLAAGYLVVNGITMARRERLRPANLLPLAVGFGILAVIGLTLTASRLDSVKVTLLTGVADILFGYVSFLLVSYVIYAFCYGRLATLFGSADFVVVLGAGLKRNGQVTPLLAKRLDRGRKVYDALVSRGGDPVLIVSGGKGSDEIVAEAAAMARYLAGHGFPADRIVLEDQSRSTEENLVFSKAIMEQALPGGRCVLVTSNFHVFRTAIIARHVGIRGQVTGAPTAGYYWPTAMLREFGAVFLRYRLVNFVICALIVILPLAYVGLRLAVVRFLPGGRAGTENTSSDVPNVMGLLSRRSFGDIRQKLHQAMIGACLDGSRTRASG
jgi:uncharacterized SAM-binding protein YcdF (DUF218 family)